MAKKDRGKREQRAKASGTPGSGSGVGRMQDVRGSGVYPESAGSAPPDAAIRTPAEWGQGERGAEGYQDAGQSQQNFTLEEAEAYQRQVTEWRSEKERRAAQAPERERPQE